MLRQIPPLYLVSSDGLFQPLTKTGVVIRSFLQIFQALLHFSAAFPFLALKAGQCTSSIDLCTTPAAACLKLLVLQYKRYF